MSFCLALVAEVCLQEEASVTIHRDGGWTGANISLPYAEVTSILASDVMLFPDRRKMSVICTKSGCLYYHIYCNAKAEKAYCDIYYNTRSIKYNKKITVTSSGQLSMLAVLRRIYFSPFTSGYTLSLASLGIKQGSEFPPYCRPKEDRGCR